MVDSRRPRSVQVQPPLVEPRRLTLISARWQVHVPPQGDVIAATATAGADLELVGESHCTALESDRGVAGRLALTFWIDRGTPDEPQRVVLGTFIQNPAVELGAPAGRAMIAEFDLVDLGDAISVVVADDRPLLRLTQVRRAAGEQPMLWCHSCIHELLGLSGGQYRLEEVSVDYPLVAGLAASSILSREAG